MRLGESKDKVPVVPRALRELSRAGLPERTRKLFIAQRRAQCLYVGVSPDIHDLRDQPTAVSKSAFWELPPDVFASKGCEVHGVILHGA